VTLISAEILSAVSTSELLVTIKKPGTGTPKVACKVRGEPLTEMGAELGLVI
jgi:hypothetical protein